MPSTLQTTLSKVMNFSIEQGVQTKKTYGSENSDSSAAKSKYNRFLTWHEFRLPVDILLVLWGSGSSGGASFPLSIGA